MQRPHLYIFSPNMANKYFCSNAEAKSAYNGIALQPNSNLKFVFYKQVSRRFSDEIQHPEHFGTKQNVSHKQISFLITVFYKTLQSRR